MLKTLTAASLVLTAVISSAANAAPPEKKPLTREACARFCGLKQKLAGEEKETYNACYDARLCTHRPTSQVEGPDPKRHWPAL